MKVRRTCEYCNLSFIAKSADIQRGWGKFCSKSCSKMKSKPGPTIDPIYRLVKEAGEFAEKSDNYNEIFCSKFKELLVIDLFNIKQDINPMSDYQEGVKNGQDLYYKLIKKYLGVL